MILVDAGVSFLVQFAGAALQGPHMFEPSPNDARGRRFGWSGRPRGKVVDVNWQEAQKLAGEISVEYGLPTAVGQDADLVWVDVVLPPTGDEIRAMVTVHEIADWPWLFDQHVASRLAADE